LAYEQIVVEKRERVGVIYLNRPEKRNPLSKQMTGELLKALLEAEVDSNVGAVVITGKGKTFCAGGDMEDFAKMEFSTAPSIYREGDETTRLFKIAVNYRKPLIAGINGPALGGGLGLAAMCHLAVASENARFGTPEIKVGIFPFVIFPLLVRAMGPRKALAMALTGEIVNAGQALEIGLVNHVVPVGELEEKVLALAGEVAGYSPLVLSLGLNAFNTVMDMEINKAMDYLNTIRVIDFMSQDLKEGAMAFLEKRQPVWKGM
jgi:enoyl-CoA hydratase/carnithine racemase